MKWKIPKLDKIFNCQKCNKTIWLKYKILPDGKTFCLDCYNEYEIDMNNKIQEQIKSEEARKQRQLEEKNKEKERERKYIEKSVKEIFDKGLSELIFNFFELKYNEKKSEDELKKLWKLFEKKYKILIEYSLFYDIISRIYNKFKEDKELVDFERDLIPVETPSKKEKSMNRKIYCDRCKERIDDKAYRYSIKHFNKPLCLEHQGTKQQRNLFFALKKRGVPCEYEAFDGHKHIDLAIHEIKLYIEIDGSHHYTDSKQMFADLMRDKYSSADGYQTKRFNNKFVEENLDRIADALADVNKGKPRLIQ